MISIMLRMRRVKNGAITINWFLIVHIMGEDIIISIPQVTDIPNK